MVQPRAEQQAATLGAIRVASVTGSWFYDVEVERHVSGVLVADGTILTDAEASPSPDTWLGI